MEPMYCCWRKGGGGKQHQLSVMEKRCGAPVPQEEDRHSSDAGRGRGPQLLSCCSKVWRWGAAPVVSDGSCRGVVMENGDVGESRWRWELLVEVPRKRRGGSIGRLARVLLATFAEGEQ